MALSKKFNNAPLSDREIIARMIASRNYQESMDAPALALYNTIANSGAFDPKTLTQTFTIPAGADPKALKSALKLIDLTNDPAVKIVLTKEMTRDNDIVERVNKKTRHDNKPKKP